MVGSPVTKRCCAGTIRSAGLLLPQDFLLIAEDCGCAEAIDWHIFEQVCRQGMKLIGADGFISINVSGRHFRSPDLDQKLLALFERYAVPTHCIRIEVTERALLENPNQVKQMLQNLRSHGVGIALDDFGTGYSSLSYLHQYPFETLKIDRSFITELPAGRSGNPGPRPGPRDPGTGRLTADESHRRRDRG